MKPIVCEHGYQLPVGGIPGCPDCINESKQPSELVTMGKLWAVLASFDAAHRNRILIWLASKNREVIKLEIEWKEKEGK